MPKPELKKEYVSLLMRASLVIWCYNFTFIPQFIPLPSVYFSNSLGIPDHQDVFSVPADSGGAVIKAPCLNVKAVYHHKFVVEYLIISIYSYRHTVIFQKSYCRIFAGVGFLVCYDQNRDTTL